MGDRAGRRAATTRIKRRVAGYYGGYARGDARHIGRLTQTRTPCSCPMCGNPRRHFGTPTIQEQRSRADAG